MKELILKSLQMAKEYLNNDPIVDTRPRYKVVRLGDNGYLYYNNKPLNCPNVEYYRYIGNSFNNGRFKEVEALMLGGVVLFKGYVTFKVT